MPNIEPLYIAILIAIVIGVVWYIQHKKESDAKNKGESILGKVKDKHDRDELLHSKLLLYYFLTSRYS